ncbi:MAG TPA: excinuclease ABC subunit UvrA [Chthonomonadaceae bacterium]|nr:excinuclease ABC subunit UvrA [Chthonomonadaceae bacterium]
MRSTLEVIGARTHNLKNIHLEIPRDKLIVFTGVSGSGKSSLAFDTIYAEGQRRYMESLSSFARRFVEQVNKPDIDFMFGLSPVVSIEQKTSARNPRSTVGTLTDISSYINLLFATVGVAHCPFCQTEVPIRTTGQIAEMLLALPAGTVVELRAPLFRVYDEDWEFVFAEVRKAGYRRLVVEGRVVDIGDLKEDPELWQGPVEVIVDKFVIRREIEKQLKVAIGNALTEGERFLSVAIVQSPPGFDPGAFTAEFGCPVHRLVMGDLLSEHFMFNNPNSACRTCLGLGTYRQVHPTLLVPDPKRSIADGAFIKEAFRYNVETWDGKIMYSLSRRYGFSLDTPFEQLSPEAVEILLHGTHGEKFPLLQPPGAKGENKWVGNEMRFEGIISRIERAYRRYRQKQEAHTHMESYFEKVMVERPCPDCHGARLRPQRLLVTVGGRNIYEFGEVHLADILEQLDQVQDDLRNKNAGAQVRREIRNRVELLLGIGLDYLNFNRPSGTLSGGEAQRIRLSTQIGSGLMGMLYVLDEPSIGLHPKDNIKMIETLRRLRDLGNTVIVVEHDEETIRAADHLVEIGPGAGVHGGEIVAQGTVDTLLDDPRSVTGAYLSGRRSIPTPTTRRQGNGTTLTICGARENNLKDVTVTLPLGCFICVTGASGSGKSTLISDILYKKLYSVFYDSRTLSGEHDAVLGIEHLKDVIAIDQSPIGRNPRSNPATYVGFYDLIRELFASVPESVERGYTAGRFSFNVKGGRCEECAGDGTVTTHLGFMPDVEVVCEACKGARYNAETLEITYQGKTIAEVLDMSIEEGVEFFASHPGIARKLRVLNDLGLGYLTLGQSATTLSGGESQRIKLATELSKQKRGGRILYIFDEPTTGLHLADIERLIECINRLVEAGNTAIVIEHHLDVIKQADFVVDLGPEGGHKGGELLFCGTPEALAQSPRSYTGRFLREHLKQVVGQ